MERREPFSDVNINTENSSDIVNEDNNLASLLSNEMRKSFVEEERIQHLLNLILSIDQETIDTNLFFDLFSLNDSHQKKIKIPKQLQKLISERGILYSDLEKVCTKLNNNQKENLNQILNDELEAKQEQKHNRISSFVVSLVFNSFLCCSGIFFLSEACLSTNITSIILSSLFATCFIPSSSVLFGLLAVKCISDKNKKYKSRYKDTFVNNLEKLTKKQEIEENPIERDYRTFHYENNENPENNINLFL